MDFTYRDYFISLPQHGGSMALRSYGRESAPTLLVLGGISGGRVIYQNAAQELGRGWWQGLVEHAELFPFRLLTLDYFGGIGASECRQVPSRIEQHAEAITDALEAAGVTSVEAIIGGSFGGCVAMELVRQKRLDCKRLAVLGAAHRPTAQAVMIRDLQREFLALAAQSGDEQRGIELARALAMLSYRGARGLDARFPEPTAAVAYMHERAIRLVTQNPPQAAQLFSKFGPALDDFRIAPVLLDLPTLVVGFSDDFLAPPHLLAEFTSQLPRCWDYVQVDAVDGHDGFILNTAAFGPQLKRFLEES